MIMIYDSINIFLILSIIHYPIITIWILEYFYRKFNKNKYETTVMSLLIISMSTNKNITAIIVILNIL